jgi:hypothetical protein
MDGIGKREIEANNAGLPNFVNNFKNVNHFWQQIRLNV